MNQSITELDVVALRRTCADLGVVEGQVGTVVEILGHDHYEVEFVDDDGIVYAMAAFSGNDLLVLHYRPVAA